MLVIFFFYLKKEKFFEKKIFNLGLQAGYQLAGLALTLAMAICSGLITGLVLKTPIMNQIKKEEELFDDSPFWEVPEQLSESTRDILF